MKKTTNTKVSSNSSENNPMLDVVNRRFFLRSAGVAAATGAFVMSACTDHDLDPGDQVVDLGSGDIGILNYAYALEQLEAAFYMQVLMTPYINMTDKEMRFLTDIRDHEIVHREFFKAALGSMAIPGLSVNFSSIDFASRASVLGTAKVFEDTGVAAYNGAGKLIKDGGYLLLAGKIVSVEARHAAIIRDLLEPNTTAFAGDDVIDSNGLDLAKSPSMILPAVAPFIATKISGNNLPK
ncbi:ferritin-like domain-containing protein [Salmonirosea aquatica]|uniref:Ferritin-like domain-containing protein n=1 Tax=Salmonirosea aquatica TaxID=2654236 RepID=A0A7C9FC87_9BACT|nr:ferritin-like domain-containing protein [Cytophagaceae bacterium SJW1-29]